LAEAALRRLQRGTRLIVASHNPGKVAEIEALLGPFGVEAEAALGLDEPAETGETFADNALLKARAAAEVAGGPALADDSGLVVPALGGLPGVQSARWAGLGRDFDVAMAKVEGALRVRAKDGAPADRRARFVCVLALCWPKEGGAPDCRTFEGAVEGRLVWPPRGVRGFGYDPMFVPDGHAETFGEMEPAVKQRISHRAQAFRRMIDACFGAP
jgi:XTP/dITP diphosphohydrolase